MSYVWETIRLAAATAPMAAVPTTLYCQNPDHSCVVDVYDRRLITKLVTGGIIVAVASLEVAVSLFRGQAVAFATALSIPSMLGLLCLLYVKHKHSPKPCTIVSTVMSFDVAVATVHWLNIATKHGASLSSMFAFVNTALRLYLLFLHERSNWSNLRPEVSKRLDREQTYGYWSRCFSLSLFDQLTRDLTTGSLTLEISKKDLEPLESIHFRKFNKAWYEHRKSGQRLLRACAYTFRQEIVLAGIAVVVKTAFKLAIPFWAEMVVSHAQQRSSLSASEHSSASHALILHTFIVLVGWLVSEACAQYASSIVHLGVQSVLGEVILAKLQKRPSAAVTQHAKLSLIADDVPGLAEASKQAFTTLATMLETFFLVCFLGYRSRYIILVLAPHLILAMPLKSFGIAAATTASAAMSALSERSDAVATMMMSMQGAIALGHKSAMLNTIRRLRLLETETYKAWRISRIGPQIIQITLNVWCDVYMITFDLDGNYQAGIVAAFFRTFIQGLLLKNTVRSALPTIHNFSLITKPLDRVQQFLQMLCYEVDVHYITQQKRQPQSMVQLKNATITTESGDGMILQNVNMRFNRGSLAVITGDDRKSLVLQAAAGNCTITNGIVRLRNRSKSYCGKDIWVQSKSIKDNIIGDAYFDEDWYRQVVQACCLEQDIASLPGCSDFIANKGTVLLDLGQLQRLALARSVYSRAAILLLDDVLCYQDAASCANLLHNLFSPGGLLRHGTTVLITADNWGQYTNLGAQFVSVTAAGDVLRTTQTELFAGEAILPPDPNHIQQLKRDHLAGSATQLMTQDMLSRKRSEDLIPSRNEPASPFDYVGDGTLIFLLAMILFFCISLMEYLQMRSILHWFEERSSMSGPIYSAIISGLLSGLMWALGAWLLSVPLTYARCSDKFDKLLNTIASARYEFFNDKGINHAISLCCERFKTLSHNGHFHIGLLCIQSMVIAEMVLVAVPNIIGLLLSVVCVIACYLLHTVDYSIRQDLTHKDSCARQELQAQFIDTATGSAHIRALGWDLKHALQSRQAIDRQYQTGARIDSLYRWTDLVFNLAITSVLALFAFFAIYNDMRPHQIGILLFSALSLRDEFPLWLRSMNGFRIHLCILKEMDDFIEQTPREDADTTKPLPKDFQVEGEIQLAQAAFGYGKNRARGLQQISLTIPKAARFGVFGEIQSGKSALMLALRGILPYTGSITLDGREIRDIPRSHLANIFAMLPEKLVVFPGATILQTLFPSEILKPGRAKFRQPTMSTILYRLGLLDIIKEVGGYEAKFEDLYLTTDQIHLFSLARLIGEHLLGKGSIFLIDGITGRVAQETHTRMRHVIREFLEIGDKTMVYTFGNDTLVLHSTHISQIVGRTIIPVPLGAPETA